MSALQRFVRIDERVTKSKTQCTSSVAPNQPTVLWCSATVGLYARWGSCGEVYCHNLSTLSDNAGAKKISRSTNSYNNG